MLKYSLSGQGSLVFFFPTGTPYSFPGGSVGKESACNAGDPGSIPGLGRSPGEGNGNPLPYSCLENRMDRGAWWATVHGVIKSWTRLSYVTFTFHFHALKKEMATHSSILAWRIPGTGEPGWPVPGISQYHMPLVLLQKILFFLDTTDYKSGQELSHV